MDLKPQYRELEEKDYQDVLDLVTETWNYAEWVQPDMIASMAGYFLNDALLVSDRCIVAEIDGRFAGIVTASVGQCNRLTGFLMQQQLNILMTLTADLSGRIGVFYQYLQTKKINQNMLNSVTGRFDGHIPLFIVKSEFKGMGLGSALFSQVMDIFRLNEVKNYFLFSDSASNHDFYRHKGMTKIRNHTFLWDEADPATAEDYYLFEGRVAKG
ncbi:GNAT family N-acetyltransferase [Enterobacter sp. 04-C-01-SI_S15]|uniref:GNAT family N-acetyltransferase n=1 Tax=Enterobacteriaceae TaxID=543 RepID=UPI00174B665D|nr:GNAT family N-acetyltransferase [Citrobacter freundii]HBM9967992.1 GNAT family N-acetyltransferase [Enterobacter chengduensis]MBD5594300.1 GNAT family N-acetyltransferase [Citrobacter freundii]HBH6881779.1 GNAT family N-acetyltransferase [Citrobacter freundii]HBH6984912.1 GNAT family N-acetyltransferase [Citrobacter freundii]HBN0078406.1 GNAT family N-acetyltransferase [Enterobacter chengduensis]